MKKPVKHQPEIPCVNFGLNTSPFDVPNTEWESKKEEFRQNVEKHGICRASWSCTGRTRHEMNSCNLANELPQFDFEIDYFSYKCIARLVREF